MSYQKSLKSKSFDTVQGTAMIRDDPATSPFGKLDKSTMESLQSTGTENYFGENARLKFFERYKWLMNQSKISLSRSNQSLEKLFFENESYPTVPVESVAFSNHGGLLAEDSVLSEGMNLRQYGMSDQDNTFLTTSQEETANDLPFFNNLPIDSEQYQLQIDANLPQQLRINSPKEFILDLPPTTKPPAARPKTAPSRRNRSPPPLKKHHSRLLKPLTNDFFVTSNEKLENDYLEAPNAVYLAGKKVYKFSNPSAESKSSFAQNSLMSFSKNYDSQKNIDFMESTVSASNRIRSAKSASIHSSRYKQNVKKTRKKKKKKTKEVKDEDIDGTISPSDRDSVCSSPSRGGEKDSQVTGTSDSTATEWLLFSDHINNNPSQDFTDVVLTSPRTKFIAHCINESMNPRVSLVVRRNLTKRLELQHQGMGDKMAISLAISLRDLPFIECINVADNMLTDAGLCPIIHAAVDIPGLIELNLSQNIIGPNSSKALHDYLMSCDCPLTTLVLNNADVDDYECSGFIEAVKQNKSLRELDLSGNLIGKSENLNTVKADIVTGSEAIADLLRSPECNLTKLQLQWNMIRLDGACDLASSLSTNSTLVHLDLSFNSLSTEGGIVLGVSLLKNKVLQTLILANNSIDSKACVTICAGIIENRAVRKVVLDDNPIGEQVSISSSSLTNFFNKYVRG
jgi:hypothetical protein